jgi:NTP pyrophosphatase (non-canonical NTP hydrolase)
MTIKKAQETVDNWIKTIGIRYFNELTNTAILTEEVGEVARLMARIYGEQSFKTPELAATAKEDLGDEMADVLFVLICLANQTGVDLTKAMEKNLDKKTKRDKARHAGNEKLKGA